MNNYLQRTTSAAPLAVFRIGLGLLLFAGVVRFSAKGWIRELYVEPQYFFSFYGFSFVRPLGEYTYILFAVCGLCALFVAAGFLYRLASAGLFLSFTYIELIDKSTYLNHYYFISLICLMMIFLPAHAHFSVDAYRDRKLAADRVPQWNLDVLKFFICLVYFYAGLAKVNSDWLLDAQPLRIWLPARNDFPVIGPLFNHVETAFVFSWLGCLYDLAIPFLLLNRHTRLPAYGVLVVFHMLTAVLFPIGMFPYIMMATALIFFSPSIHAAILGRIAAWTGAPRQLLTPGRAYRHSPRATRALPVAFAIFLLIQIATPLRYLAYPGELFWTEEGYRFSWRVMLMEKAGYAQFFVRGEDGRQVLVDNRSFLTPLQEKMMATQPDMMLQYAHHLRDHYASRGFRSPQIYVDSYVTVNGRLGRPLVNSQTDLAKVEESWKHKDWILPFENEISGL